MTDLALFLPCAAGIEDFLRAEVAQICPHAAPTLRATRGGVELLGGWRDMLALNLRSRLAQRVLLRLARAPYHNEHDLYPLAAALPWEDWFTPRQCIKVELTAQHCPLPSLNFAALRVKDAVCDRLRQHCGERPSVDTRQPDVRVFVHLDAELAWIYLDSSGEPLFKRGWRSDTGDAPLKETLAAAMLAASGWNAWGSAAALPAPSASALPLYDPCCGSGTLVIEAAQRALRIAPGRLRRFGFECLLPHQAALWQSLRQQARADEIPWPNGQPLAFGSDVAFRMVEFARRNAERAGVAHATDWRGGDALQRLPPTAQPGVLMLNPPYGARLAAAGVAGQAAAERSARRAGSASLQRPQSGLRLAREHAQHADGSENAAFLSQLASHWKRHYAGWTAWILSPDAQLPSQLRLKATRRVPLWNGPIECRLLRFELVAGSARTPRPGGSAGSAEGSKPVLNQAKLSR